MANQSSIARSIEGGILLFFRDLRGFDRFDLSVEGFWFSFRAALVTALPYLLLLLVQPHRGEAAGLSGTPYLISGGITFLFGWAFFPIVGLFLCRYYELSARYVTLIVAINWTAVPQIIAFVIAVILSLVLPESVGGMLLFIVTLGVVYIQWFVIRASLETTGSTALAFLFLDLLVNQLFQVTIEGALGGS